MSDTILLVEDNPDDVVLTQRAFSKNSIANTLVVVEDGQQALDYLFAQGEYQGRDPKTDPCLVLLDLKLPKVGGLEVLKQMRAESRTRLTPVVILTSSNEEQDIAESYASGVNSYIRKPVDFEQFLTSVQQIGLYWLVLNEPPPRK